jgi:DNA-binding MarR family transcriptional regulator
MRLATARQIVVLAVLWCAALFLLDYVTNPHLGREGWFATGDAPPAAPDQSFFLNDLRHAVNWFDEGLQSQLESAGWAPMSPTKSMILINIAQGVTRPGQIAANVGLNRQDIQLVLHELTKEGLVVLERDPEDSRATVVRYSPQVDGAQMRRNALKSLGVVESVLEKRLGATLFRQLRNALGKDWGAPVLAGEDAASR